MTTDNPAALAEAHFIGALLHLRGQQARAAVGAITTTDLADPQLRAIHEACASLVAEGRDPQPALIVPKMLALGTVSRDRAGIVNALLTDLLTGVPHEQCWPVYARHVLAESARRGIVECCQRAAQAADGPSLAIAVKVLRDGTEAAAATVVRAITAGAS